MASMYGGQSAQAFGQGFTSGYKMVDTAKTAKQTRELRAQQASQSAAQFKLSQQQTKQVIDSNQIKLDAVEAIRRDDAAKNTSKTITGWMVGELTAKDVRNYVTNNPEVSKVLQIQNPNTIMDINPSDVRNVDTPLYQYISSLAESEGLVSKSDYTTDYGEGPEFDEAGYMDRLEQIATGVAPITKTADGGIVNISTLAAMTGASKFTLSSQQRKTEELLAGIYRDINTKSTKPSAYMQVFNEYSAETDPDKRDILEMQLDKLSKTKGYELQELLDTRESLLSADTVDTKTLSDVNKRIKKLTEYAPTKVPTKIQVSEYEDKKALKSQQDLDTYLGSDFDIDAPVNELDNKLERDVRDDKTQWTTELKKKVSETEGSIQALKSAERIKELMASEDYDTGIISSVWQKWSNRLPEFLGLNETQIRAETAGNVATAKLLKEMSGLAASDNEFARTIENFIGDPSMDEKARRVIIDEYINTVAQGLTDDIDFIKGKGLLRSAKTMNSSLFPNKPNEPSVTTDSAINIDESLEGWN